MWSLSKNFFSRKAVCHNCESTVRETDNVCPYCGMRMPFAKSLCPQCSFSVEKEDSFCRNCGEKLIVVKVTENIKF